MSRQKGKAAFIGRELLKNAEKHYAMLGKSGTVFERLPLLIEQVASIERIKHIGNSVPVKCFKKDGSGIDRRRYKRYLKSRGGMIVKVNVEAQDSN